MPFLRSEITPTLTLRSHYETNRAQESERSCQSTRCLSFPAWEERDYSLQQKQRAFSVVCDSFSSRPPPAPPFQPKEPEKQKKSLFHPWREETCHVSNEHTVNSSAANSIFTSMKKSGTTASPFTSFYSSSFSQPTDRAPSRFQFRRKEVADYNERLNVTADPLKIMEWRSSLPLNKHVRSGSPPPLIHGAVSSSLPLQRNGLNYSVQNRVGEDLSFRPSYFGKNWKNEKAHPHSFSARAPSSELSEVNERKENTKGNENDKRSLSEINAIELSSSSGEKIDEDRCAIDQNSQLLKKNEEKEEKTSPKESATPQANVSKALLADPSATKSLSEKRASSSSLFKKDQENEEIRKEKDLDDRFLFSSPRDHSQNSTLHGHRSILLKEGTGEHPKKLRFEKSEKSNVDLLPEVAHRIALDEGPVVPPKILKRCQNRTLQWRRSFSHIIVLLLLQNRGLRLSRHRHIFNYHMAELFLRYLSICMDGAYFIYYEPGCAPRERFFRIRLFSDNWNDDADSWSSLSPNLVGTMHRYGASVLKSEALYHLVGVSIGPFGPAFAPFLLSSDIIQGCVDSSGKRATFPIAGAFRLLFYDEKCHSSRTVDLLTSDGAVFDIWTKAFKGLTSVNSSSVVQVPLSKDGYNTEEREAFCRVTMKSAEETARLRRKK